MPGSWFSPSLFIFLDAMRPRASPRPGPITADRGRSDNPEFLPMMLVLNAVFAAVSSAVVDFGQKSLFQHLNF
jgi:hypothetical protein